MRKVLILGASSYIGRHMESAFGSGQMICASRTGGPSHVKFDALETDLQDIVRDPDEISHAVILFADTLLERVAESPESARAVNVEATSRVIDRLVQWGIVPVFTSSDAVFGEGSGPFDEDDPADPCVEYGRHKKEIEELLAGRTHDFLIFRLCKVYGMTPGDGTLITGFAQKILRGGPMTVANDYLFTPVFIDDVVNVIVEAMRRGLSGLFHLGGPRAIRHLDIFDWLVAMLGKQVGADIELETCRFNDFMKLEKRPLDSTLSSSRLTTALQYRFKPPDEACRIVAAKLLDNFKSLRGR
jgi:dTDP-4-dehydrorhamnose reductase